MAVHKVLVLFVVYCLSLFCLEGRHLHSNAKFSDDDLAEVFEDRQFTENYASNYDDSNFKATEDNIPKVGELFEGDMVMSSRLRDAVLGQEKRSAITDDSTRWPKGVVPYTFSVHIHPYMKKLILKAIDKYKQYTCIRLIPRTTETNYVEFTSQPNTCSSSVGMIGGKQQIKLGIGCRVLGTPLHEIMHALGFIHEQSRPDRDDHIKVMYDNIKPSLTHNFQKYTLQDVTNLGVDYNYASVMHYRNNAFTKNGKDTLVSLKDPDLKFGQRVMFSSSDVKMINRLYHCNTKISQQSDYLVPDVTDKIIERKRSQRINGDDDDDEDDYDDDDY